MIDLTKEHILTMVEASREIPPISGHRPHAATIFRWCTKGVRGGVKLESARIGRRIVTSREALNRFFNRVDGAAEMREKHQTSPVPPQRTEKHRAYAMEQARKRLEAIGAIVPDEPADKAGHARREARSEYLACGGTSEEFDKAWPEIKARNRP